MSTTTSIPDPDAALSAAARGWDLGVVRRELVRLKELPPDRDAPIATVAGADAQLEARRARAAGRGGVSSPVEVSDPVGLAGPSLAELDAVLGQIADVEAGVAALHARRAVLVARACAMAEEFEVAAQLVDLRSPRVQVAPRSVRLDLARRAVIGDLATCLGIGEHAAGTIADHATALVSKAPRTLTALARGELSWAHATQITKHVADLDAPEAARVEAETLATGTSCTPALLGQRATKAREHVHPVPLDVRHAEARTRRSVWLDDGRDGTAWLVAHLPAPLAHAAYDRLTRTADHIRDTDQARTRDQLRADVFTALLLDDGTLDLSATGSAGGHAPGKGSSPSPGAPPGPPPGPLPGRPTGSPPGSGDRAPGDSRPDEADPPARATDDDDGSLLSLLCRQEFLTTLARSIRPRVNITVPVLTLLGQSQTPATLDGHIPIDPETARRLAACAPSFRRILTHPETGTPLSVGRTTYAVPADLKALLQQRDLTCRFPGCRQPAHRSDLDHTTSWAQGGQTSATNLAHLCRHHHVLKHETTWTLKQVPTSADSSGAATSNTGTAGTGGVLEWTSPTGRTHLTYPDQPPATVHTTIPQAVFNPDGHHEDDADDPLRDVVLPPDPNGDDPGPPPF